MSVRAKFRVQRIESSVNQKGVKQPDGTWKSEPQEMRTVVLAPVYSDDADSENKKFWEYTPSGEIRLGTINPAAWEPFVLDGEYYVDFTKAE